MPCFESSCVWCVVGKEDASPRIGFGFYSEEFGLGFCSGVFEFFSEFQGAFRDLVFTVYRCGQDGRGWGRLDFLLCDEGWRFGSYFFLTDDEENDACDGHGDDDAEQDVSCGF